MKTLCPAGYCHNGFVATLAHGHIDYIYNSVYVYIIYNIYVNIYIYILYNKYVNISLIYSPTLFTG